MLPHLPTPRLGGRSARSILAAALLAAFLGTCGALETASAATTLSSISTSPSSVLLGGATTLIVWLSGPAPAGGAVVSLVSSNPSALSVPAQVTVPGGVSYTFTTASTKTATGTVSVKAVWGSVYRTCSVSVLPAPTVSALTTSSTTVKGGSWIIGRVTLSAPAPWGGLVVNLSNSPIYSPAVVSMPTQLTVAAGYTSNTFFVFTRPVTANTSVTLTAATGSVYRSCRITLTP